MTWFVEYRVGEDWYSLSDREPFRWLDDNGLGAAQITKIVERGPQQHGQTRTGYRLEPRVVQAAIGFLAADDTEYWNTRELLVGTLFAPADDVNALRFTLDSGKVRQLDVRFAGDLQLGFRERSATWHRAVVTLDADEPSFYDPQQIAVVFIFGALVGGWEIPWSIPWSIAGSSVSQTTEVFYEGSWNTYPLLRIFGPITDPVIENTITRVGDGEQQTDVLDFTGTTINAGDYYEVDLRYGAKTVVDAAGVNRIDDLTDESDLATFKIYRPREAAGGSNTIRVTGSAVNDDTALHVLYYERHLGI